MKLVLPAFAILAFLILPKAAQAQLNSQQLSKVEKIHVGMPDGVKGGCLPSPNVLEIEAELILRRSGITVTDSASFPAYILDIRANGDALTRTAPSVRGIGKNLNGKKKPDLKRRSHRPKRTEYQARTAMS